jgi:hypothetical protein
MGFFLFLFVKVTSNINLYFPFNLSLYIVSTSILVMYYILTWPKIGGWKMSIIKIKNVQWKSLSQKEIKKNPFIYSDYLLKNICQEDPNNKFMFDLKEKQSVW